MSRHATARARRRPRILLAALGVTGLLAATVTAGLSATTATAATTPASGAFAGGPSGVSTFATWRGRTAGVAAAFVSDKTWTDVEVSSTWAANWGKSVYAKTMLVTLPMLPKDTTTTIQTGATGAYDAHFKLAAQHLVAAGLGNATIRVGHEFNQKWPRWSARYDPASYAAYYRHIVTAMRSVSGQSFRFTWCPSAGYAGWDATTAYPGDAYVDVVSVDSYDAWWNHPDATPQQRWSTIVTANKQGGLNFWAGFASTHAKPFGFSEWGLVNKDAAMATGPNGGGGGGDDPYYVQQMHDWIAAHYLAYESYMETDAADGLHKLEGTNFPQAATLYKQLWGATV